MIPQTYDFVGYATRADRLCTDGRTIARDAFVDSDQKVPLIWNHDHDNPESVLGHAYLENVEDGVKAYCVFNNTPKGKTAKELVSHKDVVGLSIWANKLKQQQNRVIHGKIREVSLVLAGANPGAYIENVMCHADGSPDEAIIFNDEAEIAEFEPISSEPQENQNGTEAEMVHSDDSQKSNETKGENKMAEPEKKVKTIQEIFNTLDEEQKNAVYAIIGAVIEEEQNKGDGSEMKHNVFEGECLSHSESRSIIDLETVRDRAIQCGSFARAYKECTSELMHADDDSNDNDDPLDQAYGIRNMEDVLFPDAQRIGDNPYLIARDVTWVSKFLNGAQHSPYSRIKCIAADITADEARARGYVKGNLKLEEVFTVLKRQTGPCTVYKKQKFDRDDILDIRDWDAMAWTKNEMRRQLDEEIATAALIGDGRAAYSPDKVKEDCIRPVVSDHQLFTVRVDMSDTGVASTGDRARDFINAVVYNRRKWKGTGQPVLFTTEEIITECLMLTDEIGRDLYPDISKLATKMRVREIIPVEVMEQRMPNIYGILMNPSDYTFGTDRGGEVHFFQDFDIDYNQEKMLLESRTSGALRVPYSALVFHTTGTVTPKTASEAGITGWTDSVVDNNG